MKVYNKDGKVANCITGSTCKKHGTGTLFSPVNPHNKKSLPTRINNIDLFSDKTFIPDGEAPKSYDYNSSELEYYLADTTQKVVIPKNVAAMIRELKNGKTSSVAEVRVVTLEKFNTPSDKELDVNGPRDGTPLVLIINNGFPRLRILSGTVIVQVRFSWGNSINVENAAKAAIVINSEAKATIITSGNAQVRIVPGDGSYGAVTSYDDSVIYLDDSDIEHNIRVINNNL